MITKQIHTVVATNMGRRKIIINWPKELTDYLDGKATAKEAIKSLSAWGYKIWWSEKFGQLMIVRPRKGDLSPIPRSVRRMLQNDMAIRGCKDLREVLRRLQENTGSVRLR